MGQRLVVQIEANGDTLANAYYHWSAYTGSSIYITTEILGYLNKAPKHYTSQQKAVKALYETGARFYKEEILTAISEGIDLAPFQFAFDESEANRNDGLICVSDKGMRRSLDAEEGHVAIDIITGDIDFSVYYSCDTQEYINEYGDDEDPYLLPVLNVDYRLTTENWERFANDIIYILDNGKYCAISPDHETVYQFIE